MNKVRILHLVSHPIQYFAPLYRELAARPEVDLRVVFYSDATIGEFRDPDFEADIAWNTDLLGGYVWSVPRDARNRPLPRRFLTMPVWGAVRAAARDDYDVIWIHGYAHLTAWLAWAAARVRGKRLLIREEQTLLHPRSALKRLAKATVLRLMLRNAYGLFVGERNREYLSHYGVREERLYPARYCVDNEHFRRLAEQRQPFRNDIRARFGFSPDECVVLFCGKFVPKKAPQLLIEAVAAVPKEKKCALLLVGEGPLRHELEALRVSLGVERVVFAGFLDQAEIADAYVAADVFTLCSQYDETWGLVVNEALNFGLPVVVSDKVGCATDLVREGWNGYVVGAGDVASLAAAYDRLASDDDLRDAFGTRGRTVVEAYSIAACADGIVAASLAAAVTQRVEAARA